MLKNYLKILVWLSLPLQLLLVQLLAADPRLVESVYTDHFYQPLSQLLRRLLGSIPVPVGQLLFYGGVAGLALALGRLIRQLVSKRITFKAFARRISFGTVAFLSAFYFLFTLTWGFNYHRRPIQELVQIEPRPVSTAELVTLCRRLIQLTDESRRRLPAVPHQPLALPISHQQIIARATQGFAVVARKFPELAYTRLSVKQVYVPQVMSFFGVSGIYFPFTGEANVNMHPPAFLLPATVCHEMAHQIGFASEDEANYVAYLACRLNPDPSFQYSGNYMALKYAMNRLHRVNPKAYRKLCRTYSAGLALDLAENRRYWERFHNPIAVFSDWFYDLFLKANDQTDGIESYAKVVELIMGEFRKNGLNYNTTSAKDI